jgi:capsular exopolysaccharide synthesis family protein
LKAESARKFNEIKSVFVKKQTEIDGQIETSKATIRRFIVESNIPSFAENSQQSQQGLQELQKLISETTMDLSLAKSQRGQIDAKLQGRLEASQDDVRKAEGDPALLQLMRDINDLAISMQSKKARFGPMHPEVRSGEQTLASALTQKEKVLDDIVKRDLSGQFKTISDRTGGLEDLLVKQTEDFDIERKRVEGLASRISDLEAMKDRQDRLEEERGIIANTIGELDLARAREDSIPVAIAQRALTPREISFPNWKVVLPGVWFVFVAFGVGLIFLREFLDQRVRFASELAGLASGKVLGVIPDMADDESKPRKAEFVVRELPQSVLAENYRQVSTNLLKSLSDDVGGVVGVFSAMPESGVTTIISNLASSVKVVGKRVLVIDTNFRKPGVARMFGASEDALGLSDMLAGNAEFNNVIQTTSYGIDIINAGQGRMIELLNTSKMSEVMDMARQKYDVIFIDTAPAGIAAEAIVVANRVDASILVVRAMRDQRGLVTRLVGQLSAQKGKFVGAILNRPQQTAGGYYRKNAQVMVGYGASPPKAAPAAGAA